MFYSSALVTYEGFNWRWAFGIGTVIAVVCTVVARTTIREASEFANAKRRLMNLVNGSDNYDQKKDRVVNQPINFKKK